MTTLQQVADYRTAVDDLTLLAIRDLNDLLLDLSEASPVETRNALIQVLPDVVGPYVTASGDLAATWYEDLRRDAVGGTFYAGTIADVPAARVKSLARHGVSPMFGQSDATVLSIVGGGVQQWVAGAGRDTIDFNIQREQVLVGYARIPQAGCCAFCGMLASRGADYRNRKSAGGVVGRGVDSSIALNADGTRRAGYVGGVGGGVKARGSQALGKKFHNFCKCVAVPVFEGQTFFEPIANKYKAMYDESFATAKSEYSRRDPSNAQFESVSVKETLANWRKVHGTK